MSTSALYTLVALIFRQMQKIYPLRISAISLSVAIMQWYFCHFCSQFKTLDAMKYDSVPNRTGYDDRETHRSYICAVQLVKNAPCFGIHSLQMIPRVLSSRFVFCVTDIVHFTGLFSSHCHISQSLSKRCTRVFLLIIKICTQSASM